MDSSADLNLTRWRMNSPFVQTLVLCVIVFCGPGLNSAVLGLGAGGSRPDEVPIVDRINLVAGIVAVCVGLFGGSINNQLGPRWTLIIAAASYPLYTGGFWWLDQGHAAWFPYIVCVYHGIGVALFYSAAGFIVTTYSIESDRGAYIAAFYAAVSFGSVVSSGTDLAITSASENHVNGVPAAVYIVTVSIQAVGVAAAYFIVSPALVQRNDKRHIASFDHRTYLDEAASFKAAIMSPKLALFSPAIVAVQMPISLLGSLNAYTFNSRTRALSDLCFWLSGSCGVFIIAQLCDRSQFGCRRKRAFSSTLVVMALNAGVWTAILWYLSTHAPSRLAPPTLIDWRAADSVPPLIILSFLGLAWGAYQVYTQYIVATFSNNPATLSQYSGYYETLRNVGFVLAFGLDSRSTPFLTEAVTYFSIIATGLVGALIVVKVYSENSKYGQEPTVIVPRAFEDYIVSPPLAAA